MARGKMTKEEFQRKFAEIRNKRHKTVVKGTGGAGQTLAEILRLGTDHNLKVDLGFAELKVRMKDSTSSVKLFSLDRPSWQATQSEATHKFGNLDEKEIKNLFFETRSGTMMKTGLRLFGDDESISVLSPNNDVVDEWSLRSLVELFDAKVKKMVIVTAENTSGRDGGVEHVYRTAMLLYGFSKDTIRASFLNNIITLNMQVDTIEIDEEHEWKVKNRGTDFIAKEDKLENIFKNREYL